MSAFELGAGTLRNLRGVHPRIVEAVHLAIQITRQDFCVLPNGGVRSVDAARVNAANGVGVANSLHIVQHDGYGHAVDLVAYEHGRPTWGDGTAKDRDRLYMPIREAMLAACDSIRLPIQHGADWDLDGITGERGEWDYPHWQIPNLPHRQREALAAMRGRRLARGLDP